uniref:PDZ domain-containing protein n=1 Tax=Panagrolaimus superbus TaxID=310955 RepID=A0A914Z0C7_9BILA
MGPVTTASTMDPRRPYCRIMDDAAIVRASTLPNSIRNALSPNNQSENNSSDNQGLVERCVHVYKEIDGYGLTVTGENPVYVNYVKPEGAAYHAGIRQGDRILKVNGMPVTRSNHHEVVRMISDGQKVALTLLSKPSEYSASALSSSGQTAIVTNCAYDYEIPMSKDEIRRRQIGKLNDMLRSERNHIESLQRNCGQEDQAEAVRIALERTHELERRLKSIQKQEVNCLNIYKFMLI